MSLPNLKTGARTAALLALVPTLTQAECDDDNICDW